MIRTFTAPGLACLALCAGCATTDVPELGAAEMPGYVSIFDPHLIIGPRALSRPAQPPGGIFRARSEGVVKVSLCVSADGKVAKAQVSQSSGNSELDQSTLIWARQHTYAAALAPEGRVDSCGLVMSYEWRLVPRDRHPDEQIYPAIVAGDGTTQPVHVGGPLPPTASWSVLTTRDPKPKVELSVCVGVSGEVNTAKVTRSSGLRDRDGDGQSWALDQQFRPALRDGEPVGVCGIPLTFRYRPIEE